MRADDKLLLLLSRKEVLTSQAVKEAGLSRATLTRSVQSGKIVRIDRGKYILAESATDRLFLLQQLDEQLIYSHQTALYLLGYYHSPPEMITATLPYGQKLGKQAQNILPLRVYHVTKPWYELGMMALLSPNGHWVYVYDMERTICDVLRHRYQGCSPELLIALLRSYLQQPEAHHAACLHEYAQIMQIERLLNQYIDMVYQHAF